jgi:hypothetical protein
MIKKIAQATTVRCHPSFVITFAETSFYQMLAVFFDGLNMLIMIRVSLMTVALSM